MSLPDNKAETFQNRSNKLDEFVESDTTKKLSISEIVETYHSAINISAMLVTLKDTQNTTRAWQKHISNMEKTISKFNSEIHPRIFAELAASIEESKRNLQNMPHDQSRVEAEGSAAAYEELRGKMSTMEFIKQYNVEFTNDP